MNTLSPQDARTRIQGHLETIYGKVATTDLWGERNPLLPKFAVRAGISPEMVQQVVSGRKWATAETIDRWFETARRTLETHDPSPDPSPGNGVTSGTADDPDAYVGSAGCPDV